MADYEYMIGSSLEDMANVEDLGLPPPHPAPFREWAETYEAGDGRLHGDGWPSCDWNFGYLNATMVAILREYCPDKSNFVYIQTLKADFLTYGIYYAVMTWPTMPEEAEFRMGRATTNFVLKFTHLQEVEP